MKKIFLCLLFLVVPLVTAKAESEVNSEKPYDFVLNVVTNRYEPLTPVLLTAVLRNNTASNDVYIGTRVRLLDCKLIVKDSKGQEMPPTRHYQWLLDMDKMAGTSVITIKPRQSRIFKIPVNLLYDMSVPGTYTIKARISAKCIQAGENRIFEVESDTIEIVVQNLRPE